MMWSLSRKEAHRWIVVDYSERLFVRFSCRRRGRPMCWAKTTRDSECNDRQWRGFAAVVSRDGGGAVTGCGLFRSGLQPTALSSPMDGHGRVHHPGPDRQHAYPLVSTVPASQSPSDPGTEVLNARDLHQGFSGGPRLDLIHHGDQDADLEVVYFQIDGWECYRSIGPDPNDWLVMKAPGGFVQNQDNKVTQMMAWGYSSRLYNAEVNVRGNLSGRVTVLAGFRWVNLSEDLEGILMPPTEYGKGSFWDTQTKNNLYGFQIGMDAKLLERGRFSIGSVVKAGVFDNHVEEATSVRMARI